ncbi:septal ring lytic transglycosylase RlpA family protein [Benzoatithermus flavus]|uniref:Endolytic peptidoglycan transglycosylase RlpA n=1 Tax=Benzoatithermus flavus TaxID=3108223 RepID=A0ABU8XYJ8_9PROT
MASKRKSRFLALAAAGAAVLVTGPASAQDAKDPVVFREEGKASYYGDEFQGKKTASGERFDQKDLTAAHPELPLGSEATVKNPDTGKEVKVEINDRGPHVGGRDIDLSKAAAKRLGITEKGVADVEIEATKRQVEEAIDEPGETPKVEHQLEAARKEAAKEGTPQPGPLPPLEPSQDPTTAGK